MHWQHADTLPVCSAYRFKLGPYVGWLGLDGPAQAALFQERRFDQLPRELRYVLLADASHALVESLMRTLRLNFEWSPPEADAPAFHFDAEQAAAFMLLPSTAGTSALHSGAHGCLQFVEGGALNAVLPAVPFVGAPVDAPPPNPSPTALSPWMAALRLPVRFVLGSTQIRLHEVSGIRPGDIVSIEEWGSAGAGVLVTAELGGRQGRRLVALAEGSRITVQQTKDIAMNRDPHPHTAPAEHGDVAALPIDRLDALEVTLRFEVGDLDVSLGELRSIRGGHVFDLPQPLNRSPVRILAHGNVLGKGYLVAVGDRLGVRVSEFAPSEI